MGVREKLVELLQDGNNPVWGWFPNNVTMVQLADYLIDNGVAVQELVSVKERVPNYKDGKVLVFTKYGFSICERTINGRWKGQHANWITHWAYLPQPPEGE